MATADETNPTSDAANADDGGDHAAPAPVDADAAHEPHEAVLLPRAREESGATGGRSGGGGAWWWLLPLAAAAVVALVLWRSWSERGVAIEILFPDGHGLRAGDPVRHRGIVVGEVIDVALGIDEEAPGVRVLARLAEGARSLAVEGTDFWIVRPIVGPGGVAGLETVIGPRYLALRAGGGEPARRFAGLAQPPVVGEIGPNDLEVLVRARSRGSLQAGGPVTYRGVRVGTIRSAGLASDASAVEALLHIEGPFAPLVRERTRFWDSGGVSFQAGLTGITLDVDSLAGLVLGGVAMATPPPGDAGEPVADGRRFVLHPEPEEAWLAWDPAIPLGHELLPPGSLLPEPERAVLRWEEGVFRRDHARRGWALVTEDGILAPRDLLVVPAEAREGSVRAVVAGRALPAAVEPAWIGEWLAGREAIPAENPWPRERLRRPSEPEDLLIVLDGGTEPLPVSAAGLRETGEGLWRVLAELPLTRAWHGAPAVSRVDGRVVGLLIVDEDGDAGIALVPE